MATKRSKTRAIAVTEKESGTSANVPTTDAADKSSGAEAGSTTVNTPNEDPNTTPVERPPAEGTVMQPPVDGATGDPAQGDEVPAGGTGDGPDLQTQLDQALRDLNAERLKVQSCKKESDDKIKAKNNAIAALLLLILLAGVSGYWIGESAGKRSRRR